MTVDFTDRADRRLEEIYEYIAEASGYPRRSASFVADLSRRSLELPLFAGVLSGFYTDPATGAIFVRIPYKRYFIVYTQPTSNRIIVVDFWHQARSLAALKRSLHDFDPTS